MKSLLSFSLGPVQTFISSARSVRDLWTGSYMLSWLTFQALQVVTKAEGTTLIFPAVDDHPLAQWALGCPPADIDGLLSPCLPNRFLADVPSERAEFLAADCERACREEWGKIGRETFDAIRTELMSHATEFARFGTLACWNPELWDRQLDSFFEITTVIAPLNDWNHDWQHVQRLLTSRRSVRHVPDYAGEFVATEHGPKVAAKCSLLGSYEQMGPADLRESEQFWETFAKTIQLAASQTRKRERLCAVSLVKRFAWFAYFKERKFQIDREHRAVQFGDTATVAAADWLKLSTTAGDVEIDPVRIRREQHDWSGQWLHWLSQEPRSDDDDETRVPDPVWRLIQQKRKALGKAPTYYAILMLDGDKMGDLLRNAGRDGQHDISAMLSRFALRSARQIVEQHDGTLIYSGGDDVLAMLPLSDALTCAHDLAAGFRDEWRQMRKRIKGYETHDVSVSAGLAVVHYKEDLRFALDVARQAEKQAKHAGRDCLTLTVCRHSGEHVSAILPWSFAATNGFIGHLVEAFRNGASDRWAYHLAGDLHTLRGLPAQEAMRLEISRQISRSDDRTKKLIAGDDVVAAFETFCNFRREDGTQGRPDRTPDEPQFHRRDVSAQRLELTRRALEDFVTLCQSASFLARGRER